MKVRFLLDENLSPRLKVAVLRLNPAIDIVRVGWGFAIAQKTTENIKTAIALIQSKT